MPHRQYRDADDVVWQVWDIHPMEVARQLRRLGETTPPDAPAKPLSRLAVAHELSSGWLCFESVNERRRLWPIPEQWHRMSDAELARLCSQAVEAPKPRRRKGVTPQSSVEHGLP